MGLSADGHLVFGALVDGDREESPLFGDDGDVLDLAEVLALKAGHEDPWKEYYAAVERGEVDDRSHGGYDEWCAANPDWVARKEQWYEAKANVEKGVPVEIRSFGHYDGDESPTFVLLKDREYRGGDTCPTEITPSMLQVFDDEIREAIDFCAEHDLPFENPQWYLVASYG